MFNYFFSNTNKYIRPQQTTTIIIIQINSDMQSHRRVQRNRYVTVTANVCGSNWSPKECRRHDVFVAITTQVRRIFSNSLIGSSLLFVLLLSMLSANKQREEKIKIHVINRIEITTTRHMFGGGAGGSVLWSIIVLVVPGTTY